jgi:hypothetical protein
MDNTTRNTPHRDGAPARKPWQEPAIIHERPLEVAAQGGPPREPWATPSYLGPLGTSGGTGCP